MNMLDITLGYQVSVGVWEIIVFQFGAGVLGFFIHFFLATRKSYPHSMKESSVAEELSLPEAEEWRLKYFEEADLQQQLRAELDEAKSNEELMEMEVEELRAALKQAQTQTSVVIEKTVTEPGTGPVDYLDRLQYAHESLFEHNQNIARLLEQIDLLKESEQKYMEIVQANELLNSRILELEGELADKESAIQQARQQQQLANEMKDRLGKAYDEFNALREKLLKVENTLSQPANRQFEYNELQQSYFRLTKDLDEVKGRQLSLLEENQRMSRLLADTEDKLRESNFQRQQMQKKVTFLEELNTDLQQISEQNKKLENQLKRMSEIEQLLARVAEKGHEENDNRSGSDY
jgi:DNA repair exonuclease SbcCD ATPase subunit